MQSGEVDVVSETGLTGSIEEPKHRHGFLSTGSAADDSDDAMMGLRRCEMQRVVPVAREKYAASLVGQTGERPRPRNRPEVPYAAA